jgi:flavodoxin
MVPLESASLRGNLDEKTDRVHVCAAASSACGKYGLAPRAATEQHGATRPEDLAATLARYAIVSTLVVYFSKTGHSRRIANEMAAALGADVEEIRDTTARSGLRGYLRSAREAWRGIPAEIHARTHNPRDYDLVILGTPVWAGRMSSPVRAYLEAHKRDLAHLALFCTQGGSGAENVLRAMAELNGRTPIATAFFNDAEIAKGRYTDKLRAFATALALPKAA